MLGSLLRGLPCAATRMQILLHPHNIRCPRAQHTRARASNRPPTHPHTKHSYTALALTRSSSEGSRTSMMAALGSAITVFQSTSSCGAVAVHTFSTVPYKSFCPLGSGCVGGWGVCEEHAATGTCCCQTGTANQAHAPADYNLVGTGRPSAWRPRHYSPRPGSGCRRAGHWLPPCLHERPGRVSAEPAEGACVCGVLGRALQPTLPHSTPPFDAPHCPPAMLMGLLPARAILPTQHAQVTVHAQPPNRPTHLPAMLMGSLAEPYWGA